jgi:hypothetical protein
MTKRTIAISLALCAFPIIALSQSPGPTQEQLDKAVRFGAIATLTPLCDLRDPAWAADLRRAELQAMGVELAPRQSNPARQAQADRAGAALSYAEDEALESFAEEKPEVACARLAQNPDLATADRMVAAFRAGSGQAMW